jgi:CheY-like chemotaxis protein
MPVIRGTELVRRAQIVKPSLKAMLITGYAKDNDDQDSALPRLAKPFSSMDIARELGKLLSHSPVDVVADRSIT